MATLSQAGKLAFAKEVAEIIRGNAALLTGKGFQVEAKASELEAAAEKAATAEAQQQTAKAAAKEATAQAEVALGTAYDLASADLMVIEGLLGKDHTTTTTLRKLRGGMTKPALRGKREKVGVK